MGLQAKFNLLMLVAFAIGLASAAAVNYRAAQENARSDVLRQAALMTSQAAAIAAYTREEVRPLLLLPDSPTFHPQAVPFWAAQTNFRRMQKEFPDYTYKDATLNPTNPADRPADWEADIIQTFRSKPALKEFVSERETPAGRVLSVSRPIKVDTPACLTCHSTPDAAPASMVALYGPANGFGWQMNEVVGAKIISVPMRVPLAQAHRTFMASLVSLTIIFVLMLAVLNLLLYFVIVRPVREIAGMANKVSMGDMDVPEYRAKGGDEIASLADSFNRMRRSLANALKLLDD